MFILDVLSDCNSTELSLILPIIRRIINLIQLIVPVILILYATIQLAQAVINPDEKNNNKKIFNKILAAVIIFFIPVFIDMVMGLVGENTDFSSCWNSASSNSNINVITDTDTTTTTNDVDNNDDSSGSILGKGSKGSAGSYSENSNSDDESENSSKSGSSENSESSGSSGSSESSSVTTNATDINRYIFVGDSRTVGMYIYNSNNSKNANYSEGGAHIVDEDIYIAEVSKGFSWLKNTGINAAENYFSSSTALIILMGVNDTYNMDRYITYLNENVSRWTSTGVKVYYVSVNPCDGKYSSNNSEIIKFNSKLKSNLPSGVTWIDTYSYLNSIGFTTKDGLHYDKNTSIAIYNYIKSKV